jgi:hypothetical protein
MAIYAGNIKKPVGFDQQDYPETGYVNPATGFPTSAGTIGLLNYELMWLYTARAWANGQTWRLM